MHSSTSPRRIGGSTRAFCSGVPTTRIVLPIMVTMESASVGASTRAHSSANTRISHGSRPWPPSSTGHDAPIQPRAASARWNAGVVDGAGLVHARDDLGRDEFGEHLAHLGPELVGVLRRTEVDAVGGGVGSRREARRRAGELHTPNRSQCRRRSPATIGQPRAAVEQMGVGVEAEPPAAVELHRTRGHRARRFGRHAKREDHVGLAGAPRGLPHREPRALDRGCVIGEAMADRLERSDRHAELLALGHVLDAELKRPSREPDELGRREHEPFATARA